MFLPRVLCALFLAALAAPAVAHNIKTHGNVGATFHLEPDHNPKAGETARVWFALTHKGGDAIPLSECDCQLAVYDASASAPLLQPELEAIDAERYEDIPGAEIVFPEAGAYDLVLRGAPARAGSFEPFELRYTVNVSRGGAAAPETLEPASEDAASQGSDPATTESTEGSGDRLYPIGWLVPGGIGLVAVIAGIAAVARRKVPIQDVEKQDEGDGALDSSGQ